MGWNVPADELVHIPSHWLKFSEVDPMMHYSLGLVYCFFWVAALTGNGLVIWIFTTTKTLRTPSNMFVVNLAILDFLMMTKAPIFIYNSFNKGFSAGHLACQIFAFIGSCSGIGAALTNACIAYDRYTTIARPFDGRVTKGRALVMLIFVWAYTLPWAIMPLLEVWGRFVPEGFLTSCSFDYLTTTPENQFFVVTIFIFSYALPMSLIIYFYSQIVSHVVNHEKTLREQAKKMNVESLRSNQQQNQMTDEIRISKAAISICFLFVASWTPYAVMALIGAFGNQDLLTPSVSMIPALSCKFVACLDPYVYAISHPRYRLELQKRLPWLNIDETKPQGETSSVTTTNTNSSTTETPN
ncbi:Opsin, ultraviolet-sensitive [Cryptotermes secundus]|nr:opsin, ultraviolet-sensitive isoform X2 [Cryptotermes secundus]PNF37095.1 Opsin, ultraviolet-sensitive [Cryptotermes secundus]